MRSAPAKILKLLLRALDRRRVGSLWNRTDIVADHIRDRIGVSDYYLKRLFFSKVVEFLQHFVGGAKIQRSLIICVLVALSRLQNGTENSVLFILEVNVAGRNTQLSELVREVDDTTVEHSQSLLIGNATLAHKELIVRYRLNFKIIIHPCDLLNLLLRLTVQYRAE